MKLNYFLYAFVFILCLSNGYASSSVPKGVKIPERGFISSKPAATWEEGLISGNGILGVNILSRPLDETIIFSHERLFLPQGPPTVPPDNSHLLFEIRNLIDKGLYKQATEYAAIISGQQGFMYPDPT